MASVGKQWWIWSQKDKEFDIVGYTKPAGGYLEDAFKAVELLSKHIKKPIPGDIKIEILGSDQ